MPSETLAPVTRCVRKQRGSGIRVGERLMSRNLVSWPLQRPETLLLAAVDRSRLWPLRPGAEAAASPLAAPVQAPPGVRRAELRLAPAQTHRPDKSPRLRGIPLTGAAGCLSSRSHGERPSPAHLWPWVRPPG